MVAFMLYRHSLLGAALTHDRIASYFSDVLINAIAFNLDTEALWALWIFKVLRYKLPKTATAVLSKSNNSFVALLALDLRDAGLLNGTLDVSYWTSLLTPVNLYSGSWLLVYESIVKDWLSPSAAFISSDPFFGPMQSSGVFFYQPNRTADIAAQLGPRSFATSAPEINIGAVQYFLLETSRSDVTTMPDLTINLDDIEDEYETDEFDEGEGLSDYFLY
jgi:hypothetical protein